MSVRRVQLQAPGTTDVEVDADAQALGVNRHGELNIREPGPRVRLEMRRYHVVPPEQSWPAGSYVAELAQDGQRFEVWEEVLR